MLRSFFRLQRLLKRLGTSSLKKVILFLIYFLESDLFNSRQIIHLLFVEFALDLEANVSLDKDLDDVEETVCDRDFEKFTKRTKEEPTQIVRYDHGGEPFWVTNNEKLRQESAIPNCSHCHSKRVFEFQINPQLLNYLGIDDNKQLSSVDWAGLNVYTCSKSCSAAIVNYAEEFIYKQDFVWIDLAFEKQYFIELNLLVE